MICFIHLRIGIPPYLRFSFYKKMYLHTNSTASTYISGVDLLCLTAYDIDDDIRDNADRNTLGDAVHERHLQAGISMPELPLSYP